MDSYFQQQELVNALAIKRAAYSDRMAWIMAELSRLVYEELPVEQRVSKQIDEVYSAVKSDVDKAKVEKLIFEAINNKAASSGLVTEHLKLGNFELVESIAVNGTEVILVKHSSKGIDDRLILVFRGTQPDIKDVATDIKADLVSAPGGGRVHSGFLTAYKQVEPKIKSVLEKYSSLSLYITGHSLGGALAMIATRYLGSDSTGSTYTFGCPRVGDDEFYKGIKTPVYRIVNAADAVPRVPFGYGFSLLLVGIRLIPINFTYTVSEWLRRHFLGYTHYGNLVFLSDTANQPCEKNIPFAGLIVKHSPNIFWRTILVFRRWLTTRGQAGGTDHRMLEYSEKLGAYALRRLSR